MDAELAAEDDEGSADSSPESRSLAKQKRDLREARQLERLTQETRTSQGLPVRGPKRYEGEAQLGVVDSHSQPPRQPNNLGRVARVIRFHLGCHLADLVRKGDSRDGIV